MIKISREEVLKIAEMSNLVLHEDEVEPMLQQLSAVLSYAERVQDIATQVTIESSKNINVMRDDQMIKTAPAPLLDEAPEREATYFVVPSILETK